MKTILGMGAVLILSVTAGCSSNPSSTSSSEPRQIDKSQIEIRRETLMVVESTGLPYTGTVVSYYRSGEKESSTQFKQGVQFGTPTQWYRNGQKKAEANIDTNESGTMTSWYEDGQLLGKATVANGMPVEVMEWHSNGQLRIEATYLEGRINCRATWDTAGNKQEQVGTGCGGVARDVKKEAILKNSSIAVLPFVNMSQDPSGEYFSDYVTESVWRSLINMDANVADVRAGYKYEDTNTDIATIAEELEVEYILEGSVRKGDDRVRITAQLIRAADGYHLWSQTYDRMVEDLQAIQQEIGEGIANALTSQ